MVQNVFGDVLRFKWQSDHARLILEQQINDRVDGGAGRVAAQDLLAGDFRGLSRRHAFCDPGPHLFEMSFSVALAIYNFARVEEVGHLSLLHLRQWLV